MNIFTYGCSFTKYKWPTYADILALQYRVYNRGESGSGNERIFYHFMEDVRSNNIDSNDIVIFQWSGLTRFDYLLRDNTWWSVGNVLNQFDKDGSFVYSKIKDWFNPDYEFEKTVNYKIAAEYITTAMGCKTLQMSLCPIVGHDETFLENNLWDNYHGSYKFFHAWFQKKNKKNSVTDEHPTIIQHNTLAHKVAEALSLDFNIDERKIQNLHNYILAKKDFRLDYSFNDIKNA